jgi:hypothetical protein
MVVSRSTSIDLPAPGGPSRRRFRSEHLHSVLGDCHIGGNRVAGAYLYYYPSTRARAASDPGSQNVISRARYNSMAAESSTRASSGWSIPEYRIPRPR